MLHDVDMELAARLTLNELLLEVIVAQHAAWTLGGGAVDLADLRGLMLNLMVNCARSPSRLTAEQRDEWELQASVITQRFFDKAERRRADIVRRLQGG